jgi:hypothetical protein
VSSDQPTTCMRRSEIADEHPTDPFSEATGVRTTAKRMTIRRWRRSPTRALRAVREIRMPDARGSRWESDTSDACCSNTLSTTAARGITIEMRHDLQAIELLHDTASPPLGAKMGGVPKGDAPIACSPDPGTGVIDGGGHQPERWQRGLLPKPGGV